MSVLQTQLNSRSAEFLANAAALQAVAGLAAGAHGF